MNMERSGSEKPLPEGYKMPGLKDIPTEKGPTPEEENTIKSWPDLTELEDDASLPGEDKDEYTPPTLH